MASINTNIASLQAQNITRQVNNDLEKAMDNKDDPNYQKYLKIREKNLHKMNPIPVCKFNE